MEKIIKRRRKRKYLCPNPLFEKWLTEWRDSAANKGLKTQFIFAKALTSLKKYPIPLSSGKEAKILEFFGDKICMMLDEKLQQYQQEDCAKDTVMSETEVDVISSDKQTARRTKTQNGESQLITSVDNFCVKEISKSPRKHQRKKSYIPTPRSGSHAILIALINFEMNNDASVKKAELIAAAQLLCDASFTVPLPGSRYTSWNCMGQLIRKGLVEKKSNPSWYSLTDSGHKLALKLMKEADISSLAVSKNADICNTGVISCNKNSDELLQTAINTLHPVIMLNDKRSFITDSRKEQQDCIVGKDFKSQYSINYDKTCQDLPSISHSCNKVSSSEALSQNIDSGFTTACSSNSTTANSPSIQNSCESTIDSIASSTEKFSLIPGNFDILLCVDSCETISGAIKQREILLNELRKNGIDFHVRKLNVGDFLWIAQERIYSHMEIADTTPRELVLDFIVERKRMDDLASSIKDGRFREQKFRLRNCGARRLVYLVEECNSSKYYGIPESTLEQAIVNTQVVDGFTIKRTKDIKESIAYLTIMTRFLQNLYKYQTLVSGSREEIQDSSCSLNVFMTYKEFNSISVKNKCLQVKEMFAKHLLQLYGLSVDKAAVIIEKYETPAKLFEAYNSCASEEEKIKLLSTLKCGKTQRNFGVSLSRTVYQLYCTEGSLS